jgi:phosphoribosylaminoimidazolecarboxamide formyltransferase / IMP cyclohydrolase
MSGERVPVRRALVSVSDKSGLADLGRALAAAGVELVSTGSTAAVLREAGAAVTDVAAVTGFPESLDGRVKTLHPGIHAGLLADLRRSEHAEQLEQLGIEPFELVVASLYPFEQAVAAGADEAAIVEQIDIGGPALVRAAAKNHANVAVVVDPSDYGTVLAAIDAGGTTLDERRALAAHAFTRIADYDRAIADWFTRPAPVPADGQDGAPPSATAAGPETVRQGTYRFEVTPLRYGENPHQSAAVWRDPAGTGLAQAEQLHGREMSYNNYVDADAAVKAVADFAEAAVAIVKHANPCGIAIAPPRMTDPIAAAHRRAHECDPVSAFGGVIAANRTVTLGMAETIAQIFTEVVVAPDFEPAALRVLTAKKNVRLLRLPPGATLPDREFRQISGGLLVQDPDRMRAAGTDGWRQVTGDPVDAETLADLLFAWKACRAVKSNAILLASGGATVGIGMGQVNRVDSCSLAVRRAGKRAAGSVAASDAFFPFSDGPEVLLKAGVRAVVQPGGSVRDGETIELVGAAGAAMFFTGERHFLH